MEDISERKCHEASLGPALSISWSSKSGRLSHHQKDIYTICEPHINRWNNYPSILDKVLGWIQWFQMIPINNNEASHSCKWNKLITKPQKQNIDKLELWPLDSAHAASLTSTVRNPTGLRDPKFVLSPLFAWYLDNQKYFCAHQLMKNLISAKFKMSGNLGNIWRWIFI